MAWYLSQKNKKFSEGEAFRSFRNHGKMSLLDNQYEQRWLESRYATM